MPITITPDILWRTSPSSLRADLYEPDPVTDPEPAGGYPAVVLLPGSTGDEDILDEQGQNLATLGYVAFATEYRHAQEIAHWLEDVADALAWLRARSNVNGAKIGVFGTSRGGIAASWAAALSTPANPIQAAVSWSAGMGQPPGVDPTDFVTATSAPLYLAHAVDDAVFDYESSLQTYEAFQAFGRPSDLRTVAGSTHGINLENDPVVGAESVAWLDQYVAGATSILPPTNNAPILYVVDVGVDEPYNSAEAAAVDLNAMEQPWNGAPVTRGFALVDDPDFGSIATDPTDVANRPFPGSAQSERWHPKSTMTMRLRSWGFDSFDELVAHARLLGEHLDRDGVIYFRHPASPEPIFFDYQPSPIASLLRGQDRGSFKILTLLQDSDGLPVTVWRRPYSRGPQITTLPPSTVTNQVLTSTFRATGHGNAESLTRLKILPDVPTGLVQIRMARKSGLSLEEATLYELFMRAGECEAMTNVAASGLSNVADATASGGSKKRYSSTAEHYQELFYRFIPASTLAGKRACAGRYEARLYFATDDPPPAETLGWNIGMSWGTADEVPGRKSRGPFFISTEQLADADVWMSMSLGEFALDEFAGGLRIGVHAQQVVPEGVTPVAHRLDFDCVRFFPIDEQVLIWAAPGIREPRGIVGGAAGDVLVQPIHVNLPGYTGNDDNIGVLPQFGNDEETTYMMGTRDVDNGHGIDGYTNEALGMRRLHGEGTRLPPGLIIVTATITFQDNQKNGSTKAELRARRSTDNGVTWTDFRVVPLRAVNGKQYSTPQAVLAFHNDDVAYLWDIQIVMTSTRNPQDNTAAGEKVFVKYIELLNIGSVNTPEWLVLNGVRQIQYTATATGSRLKDWSPPTIYPELAPGVNVWVVELGEEPLAGMLTMDKREPLVITTPANSAEITLTEIPRNKPW
jgi:dienelactone hydrolase